MSRTAAHPVQNTASAHRRAAVRRAAASCAVLASVLYLLIGARLVTVAEDAAGHQDGAVQTAFGIPAAIGFLIGAIVIMRFDRRVLWILGAVAQAFIIFTYFNLAPERTPSFEFWGLLIRVPQVVLLGALIYLAVRPAEATKESPQ